MDFVDKQGSSAGTSAHHPWWDEVRYSNNPVVGQSPDAAASVATVVTSSEIDWLNQQLTDIQQLRRHSQLNGGDGRAEQREEVNVNNAELRQDQEVGDNASNIQAARPHSAAASPCRHGNRHHRRRHHRRRRYHRRRHSPTSFSSRTSSSLSNTRDGSSAGSASSSSSTDSESESSRSSHAAAAADAVGAASRSFAAMPKQVDSGLGGGPSIESVYTNFLSISQRLSSLISEYYSGAAPLDFKSQQQPPPLPPPPPTRQLSLQQHRSESVAGGSGSNSKGGFGSRIRASLSKKFSPRQRHTQQDEQSAVAEEHLQQQQKQHENFNQKKELASRPTATTTAAASGAASSTVDYPRSNIGREAAVNEAASATKESSTTALAAAAAVSAAGESARQPVGLDSRVPLLFSDSQPADPCLAKLQRLRATVLDLVQRSVDPVLKSLRDIQSAGTGGGAKAAPQTAGA
uniref:CEP170_C domain-containing protein n=1 Tax=Macrostomum lignano TaxID=282301 RepID=A0A1I8HBM5_9PLAT